MLNYTFDFRNKYINIKNRIYYAYSSLPQSEYNKILNDLNEIVFTFMNKNKFNILPDKVVADRDDIENTNGYAHENEKIYLDSYISIVTETSFYIENDFISEKILKNEIEFNISALDYNIYYIYYKNLYKLEFKISTKNRPSS